MLQKPTNLIIFARRFARDAHKAIIIKTVSEDIRSQFEHLQEVADLVWASGGSDIEIASAWLHDSVEDTETTSEDLEKKFGKEVAEIVKGLTDSIEIKDLPTAERKARQAERVKTESLSVRRIKLADQTSNVRFVTTDPKEGWPKEKNRLYIIGAKLIADQCKGISPMLDQLFNQEYERAMEFFKI